MKLPGFHCYTVLMFSIKAVTACMLWATYGMRLLISQETYFYCFVSYT